MRYSTLIQSSGPEVTQMISLLQKHKVVFMVVFMNFVFISFQMGRMFCVSWRRLVCLEISHVFRLLTEALDEVFWWRLASALIQLLLLVCVCLSVVFILTLSLRAAAGLTLRKLRKWWTDSLSGNMCLYLVPFKSLNWVIGKLLIILKSTRFSF